MLINIRYCNNIEDGEINIQRNTLNIKYGINGTGKTTISKAIEFYTKEKQGISEELGKLRPFKYYGDREIKPHISGLDDIQNIKAFNEEYIEKYVF